MSADTQGSTSGTRVGGAASEAALIATFYGPGGDERIQGLYDKLRLSLPEPPEALLEGPFEPPGGAAHDTNAVQLALNSDGEAAEAWEDMRQKLEETLSDTGGLEGTWGHTLIYQAELNEGVDADDSALEELLPAIRRLHSSEEMRPLAAGDVSGGRLWLLAIPDRGEGLEAATVYVALGPPKGAEALLNMLYGPGAALLELDLIAHKSYYQMRQYRGDDLEDDYEESVDSLRQTTNELLIDMSGGPAKTDELDELARKYRQLFPVVSQLSELHISLVKQKHNYERSSRALTGGREVLEFHSEQLETATLELKLKVEELQFALEAADKAVSIAQVKVDEAQESRQLGIEALLAAVGIALALPHLLEPETTRALLNVSLELLPGELHVPHTDGGLLVVLGAQFVIIGAVAFLAYRQVKGSLSKRPKLSKRAQP